MKICMAIVSSVTSDAHKLGHWNLIGILYWWIEHFMIETPIGTRLTCHLVVKSGYMGTDAVGILSFVYAGTGRVKY
jgi:hypothetical protein